MTIRYGLAGLSGLALLTGVHQVRGRHLSLHPAADYLVGVLPNFAAAIAITFVLLSIWSDQHRNADIAATRRAFRNCLAISGIGLIAWELFQIGPNSLIFDLHDIGATLVGLAVCVPLFAAMTPQRAAVDQ